MKNKSTSSNSGVVVSVCGSVVDISRKRSSEGFCPAIDPLQFSSTMATPGPEPQTAPS